MEGPLPQYKRGWISFFFAITMVYLWYYLAIYGDLFNHYLHTYWNSPSYIFSQNPPLEIIVRGPLYVSNFVERSLMIQIKNKNDYPIGNCPNTVVDKANTVNENPIVLTLFTTATDAIVYFSTIKSNLSFSMAQQGSLLPDQLVIDCIPAQSSVVGVVYIYVQQLPKNTSLPLGLSLNGKPTSLVYSIEVDPDPWKAFQHTFIENLFLPPWSNVWLFSFILIAINLAEVEDENDDLVKSFVPGLIDGVIAVSICLFLSSLVLGIFGGFFPIKLSGRTIIMIVLGGGFYFLRQKFYLPLAKTT